MALRNLGEQRLEQHAADAGASVSWCNNDAEADESTTTGSLSATVDQTAPLPHIHAQPIDLVEIA